jgi:tetratricopeptide (TPR) repeat protein
MGHSSIFIQVLPLFVVLVALLFLQRLLGKHASKTNPAQRGSTLPASKNKPEPVANIPPEKIDTEGAIEDMRLAHSYLEDWISKSPRAGDHLLGLAAKYIESARHKDPNAKLVVEEKGEDSIYSQDDLSGWALFYESQIYSGEQADRKRLEKARDILEKAIAYAPFSIQYRSHLADVYLNLHDRNHALAAAQEAIEVSPKNLDARKLIDRIEAAPITSAPTYLERNPELLTILAGLMLMGGFIALVASIFGNYGNLAGWLLIGGGALWFYGRSKEKQRMLNQAIADIERKNKG